MPTQQPVEPFANAGGDGALMVQHADLLRGHSALLQDGAHQIGVIHATLELGDGGVLVSVYPNEQSPVRRLEDK